MSTERTTSTGIVLRLVDPNEDAELAAREAMRQALSCAWADVEAGAMDVCAVTLTREGLNIHHTLSDPGQMTMFRDDLADALTTIVRGPVCDPDDE